MRWERQAISLQFMCVRGWWRLPQVPFISIFVQREVLLHATSVTRCGCGGGSIYELYFIIILYLKVDCWEYVRIYY